MHHQWGYWTDRERSTAFRIDVVAGRKARERAVEPASEARARLQHATLEHVLTVEMRALAILSGDCVNDDRFVCLEHAMEVRHRRIKCKEVIELQRRRLSAERQRIVAA